VDNRFEDDEPMHIPARRSYEIVQYPVARRRPSFLVLFFVIFSALLAFWLVRNWIHAYQIRQTIQQVKKEFPQEFAPGGIAAMEHRTYVPAPPPLVGPYRLPLSAVYRLAGMVGTSAHEDYLATAGPGAYIMIPAKNCQIVNGGPFCKYHGSTVTRSSGG
jgi:hypothetical protein